jgi:hypothetical protein
MRLRTTTVVVALLAACAVGSWTSLSGQQEQPAQGPGAPPQEPAAEPPPVPKGIEVLARGPVHEAFASLAAEPAPTKPVDKKPPAPLDEIPPAEKPEGNMIWIGGYWAWDDERTDYLWVSGIWRTSPPGKQWVAGYWREEGEQWQWVPGFWTAAVAAQPDEQEAPKQITYLPQPPVAPEVAAPGQPPTPDTFYVPGTWVWTGANYAWRAGYWARVQPGYVWVPDHYRWTPSGYVYIPGYWDYSVARRGVLYAPVVVDPAVVRVGFYYSPAYAVSDAVVVDALFVRPAYCHYYFGDYYGPTYVSLGFQSGYVYSRSRYDSIVVYESWQHRDTPNWVGVQIDIVSGRSAGRLPVPPRTLVQQNTIIQQNITNVNINNNTTNVTNINNVTNNTNNVSNNTNVNRTVNNYNAPVLATTTQVAAAKGVKTVALDPATRQQAQQQASAVQQVAAQRTQTETPLPPGSPRQARVASLSMPQAKPVQPGFVAPAAPKMGPTTMQPATGSANSSAAVRGNTASAVSHNPSTAPTTQPGRSGTAPTTSGNAGAMAGYGRPGTAAPGSAAPGQMTGRPGAARPTTTMPSRTPPPKPGIQPRPTDNSRRPPPKDSNNNQRSP